MLIQIKDLRFHTCLDAGFQEISKIYVSVFTDLGPTDLHRTHIGAAWLLTCTTIFAHLQVLHIFMKFLLQTATTQFFFFWIPKYSKVHVFQTSKYIKVLNWASTMLNNVSTLYRQTFAKSESVARRLAALPWLLNTHHVTVRPNGEWAHSMGKRTGVKCRRRPQSLFACPLHSAKRGKAFGVQWLTLL